MNKGAVEAELEKAKKVWAETWRRLVDVSTRSHSHCGTLSLALRQAKRAEQKAAKRLREAETNYTFTFTAGGDCHGRN